MVPAPQEETAAGDEKEAHVEPQVSAGPEMSLEKLVPSAEVARDTGDQSTPSLSGFLPNEGEPRAPSPQEAWAHIFSTNEQPVEKLKVKAPPASA